MYHACSTSFYIIPVALSGHGKKILTTSFGSSTSGADYLSTTLERRRPSKEVSETPLGMYMAYMYF